MTTDETPEQTDAAPKPGEQLETPGSRQRRELDEMRNIGKRLEQLDPKARKRVLSWLVDHYGGDS